MSRNTTLTCLAVSVLAACGGDQGGETGDLDCAFVESSNCWKQLVDEIATCAPNPDLVGTFTADRTACVYSDGARVAFDEPVPETVPDDYDWRLTVLAADGSTCARWDDAGAGAGAVDLAVSAGADQVSLEGTTSGLTLTCPDGSAFFTGDPLSVITGCGEGREYGLPVTTIRQAPGYLGLAIAIGEEPDGRDIEVDLFSCNDAP